MIDTALDIFSTYIFVVIAIVWEIFENKKRNKILNRFLYEWMDKDQMSECMYIHTYKYMVVGFWLHEWRLKINFIHAVFWGKYKVRLFVIIVTITTEF